jgi:dihydropteroate synthase
MGVLNVTPDSFSDGGRHRDVHEAVAAGHAMFEAGADIVDVGAESTRPGAVRVPARQQLDRAAPVIERLSAAGPVSIDTTLAEVAAGAIAAGACIVNDVSACTEDPGMAALAAGREAGLVMMHRLVPPDRDRWSTERDPRRDAYGDVVAAVRDWLSARVEAAVACGVAREAIAVDPGFGFGKDVAQNLVLLARIAEFRAMGLPVAAGVSRKSFIGAVTGCDDPVARDPASALAAAIAVAAGASIVRAHDVRSHRAAIDLAAAAARAG